MEILLAVMLYLNVKNICLVTTQRANGIFENFPEMKRSRSQSSLIRLFLLLSPSFSVSRPPCWHAPDRRLTCCVLLAINSASTLLQHSHPKAGKHDSFNAVNVNVGVKVVNPECYVVCKTSCQQKCSFHTKFTKGFPVFTLCLTPSL